MLIYGQILGDDDCDFNVTDTTENFLIYFFGFYNHNITDNLYSFLNELNIKNILTIILKVRKILKSMVIMH